MPWYWCIRNSDYHICNACREPIIFRGRRAQPTSSPRHDVLRKLTIEIVVLEVVAFHSAYMRSEVRFGPTTRKNLRNWNFLANNYNFSSETPRALFLLSLRNPVSRRSTFSPLGATATRLNLSFLIAFIHIYAHTHTHTQRWPSPQQPPPPQKWQLRRPPKLPSPRAKPPLHRPTSRSRSTAPPLACHTVLAPC